MMNLVPAWGLMGPDGLASLRRVRTLDVGASVRQFNELAVPGMGSIWTGRQLLWPLLGIAAAGIARASISVSNIEAANAVEALACRMALDANGWQRDARIRGAQKLLGAENLTFKAMRRPGFYVTQPMRMSAVQPLLALGFVESQSERFNSYNLAEAGESLLETACAPYLRCWYSHGVVSTLAQWFTGNPERISHIDTLREAITPLAPLPELAAQTLREQLAGRSDANSLRRRSALAWVRACQNPHHSIQSWEDDEPPQLDSDHWSDLRAGAQFFNARAAAIAVLDACERLMGPTGTPLVLRGPLPDSIKSSLETAQVAATAFLSLAEGGRYHPSGVQMCVELSSLASAEALRRLVARDGRVLRLSGDEAIPGVAFDGGAGTPDESEDGVQNDGSSSPELADRIRLPAGISFRMRNLFLLDLDLQGDLDAWLGESTTE